MPDPQLTVLFELLNRRENTALISWSINTSYLVSTDAFSFTLYHAERSLLRRLELEPVELILDGNSQVLGRVDVTTIGNNGSALECQGRDYIADIVECNVDPSLVLKEGMTVFEAITLAAGPCGISKVVSDEDVILRNIRTGKSIASKGAPRTFRTAKLDDYKPGPGSGIYQFINNIAARHGATIQPGADRATLVLAAPNYKQEPLYRVVRAAGTAGSTHNNVVSASCTRNYSSFPTFTLTNGKPGRAGDKASSAATGIDMGVLASAFNEEMSTILDGAIVTGRQKPANATSQQPKLYRLLHVSDKEARNADQVESAAKRAIAERLKDTLEYSVTLKGVVDPVSGAIWSVDTMVHVVDEICGIDEELWIAERTLRWDASSGATTELKCWRPESFQVE